MPRVARGRLGRSSGRFRRTVSFEKQRADERQRAHHLLAARMTHLARLAGRSRIAPLHAPDKLGSPRCYVHAEPSSAPCARRASIRELLLEPRSIGATHGCLELRHSPALRMPQRWQEYAERAQCQRARGPPKPLAKRHARRLSLSPGNASELVGAPGLCLEHVQEAAYTGDCVRRPRILQSDSRPPQFAAAAPQCPRSLTSRRLRWPS